MSIKIITRVCRIERKEIICLDIKIESKKQAIKIVQKLIDVKKEIVEILRKKKEEGEIKSIFRPKNKKVQMYLDDLVNAKRQNKKSIEKIKEIYL